MARKSITAEPWDRTPEESPPAYAAFVKYRDMGAVRSLRKLAAEDGIAFQNLGKWSTTYDWRLRCVAWDSEQDRIYRAGMAKTRREMGERHARVAAAIQGKVIQRLQTLDPERLSARDAGYLFELAAKIERQALGEPDRLEVTGADGGPLQVSNMTAAERRVEMERAVLELQNRLSAYQTTEAD